MIVVGIIGLCVGAILAQHFRALIIVPTSLVGVVFAASAALIGAHGASQILLETLSAAAALQIGYFFGLSVRPVAADPREATQFNTVWPS
jgi:hypothetical protein